MSSEYLFYVSIPVLAVLFFLFYRFMNGLEGTERALYLVNSKSKIRVPLALGLFGTFFYFSAIEVKIFIGGILIVAALIDSYFVQKKLKRINFKKTHRRNLVIMSATSEAGVMLFLSSYLVR